MRIAGEGRVRWVRSRINGNWRRSIGLAKIEWMHVRRSVRILSGIDGILRDVRGVVAGRLGMLLRCGSVIIDLHGVPAIVVEASLMGGALLRVVTKVEIIVGVV